MTRCAITILTLFVFNCFANSPFEESKSVITAPSISSKCRVLLENRDSRLKFKQRLAALIERNIKLQHKEIDNIKVKEELISNLRKLRNEYILSKDRIRTLTNDIVNTGCPGISI